jgi:hypothetical protein
MTTNWIPWEIDDPAGENPFGVPGEFEFNVEFDYDPGEPTILSTLENEGSPGYPPQTTVTGAQCIGFKLSGEHAEMQSPTCDENEKIAVWFMALLDDNRKLKRQIEACGLDQMYVESDDVDWDD